MDSLNSFSSNSPKSEVNYTIYIKQEQSPLSPDEYSHDIMPVIADVKSIDSPRTPKPPKIVRTSTECYGPILIRKRHTAAPTLATGRRSKHAIREGEDASKQEIRRMKNRESARNLKKLRDSIEHDLETKVTNLTSEEQHLMGTIQDLRTHKQCLEQKVHFVHSFIPQTTASEIDRESQQISHTVTLYCLKQEPRSPSPCQYRQSFCI